MTQSSLTEGRLFIVASPIGNLADASDRMRDTLAAVDLILAEDTRVCRRFLQHFGVTARVVSCHDHNEEARVGLVIDHLDRGLSVAFVSDAGTPLISDPGYRLVTGVMDQGHRVIPIPGPSAVTAALSVAGLPVDRFVFEGFLPRKAGPRRSALANLKDESRAMVFFESSHRILASMADFVTIFGNERRATLIREMTKQFETIKRDTLETLQGWLNDDANQQRGEFVIVVSGNSQPTIGTTTTVDRILKPILAKLSVREAVEITVEICDRPRNEVYQRALELSRDTRRDRDSQ